MNHEEWAWEGWNSLFYFRSNFTVWICFTIHIYCFYTKLLFKNSGDVSARNSESWPFQCLLKPSIWISSPESSSALRKVLWGILSLKAQEKRGLWRIFEKEQPMRKNKNWVMIVTESKTWENSTEKIENLCRVRLLLRVPRLSHLFLYVSSRLFHGASAEKTSLQLSKIGSFSWTLVPTLFCFSAYSTPTVVSTSLDSKLTPSSYLSHGVSTVLWNRSERTVILWWEGPFFCTEENRPLCNFHLLVLFFLFGSAS